MPLSAEIFNQYVTGTVRLPLLEISPAERAQDRLLVYEMPELGDIYSLAIMANKIYEEDANIQTAVLGWGFELVNLRIVELQAVKVFVLTNEHHVFTVFRGTENLQNWQTNLTAWRAPIDEVDEDARLHMGFSYIVQQFWPQLAAIYTEFNAATKQAWFTGHSLGAALATIAGLRYNQQANKLAAPYIYAFAQPRVGNAAVMALLKDLHIRNRYIRFVHRNDIVPSVPLLTSGYEDLEEAEIWIRDDARFSGKFISDRIAARAEKFRQAGREEQAFAAKLPPYLVRPIVRVPASSFASLSETPQSIAHHAMDFYLDAITINYLIQRERLTSVFYHELHRPRFIRPVVFSTKKIAMVRSLLKSELIIDKQSCVLSLVHKPAGRNAEHAFLLVEKLSDDELFVEMHRYDLFSRGEVSGRLAMIAQDKGIVKIKPMIIPLEQREAALAELLGNEQVRGISYPIKRAHAQFLYAAVKKDEVEPPSYLLSGDQASGPSIASQRGQNCYSWASGKIKDMAINFNLQDIKADSRLKTTWKDFIAARTTEHLYMPPAAKSGCLVS